MRLGDALREFTLFYVTLDREKEMAHFVNHGITDLWLLFFLESIPPGLSPSASHSFLKTQTIVLTEGLDLGALLPRKRLKKSLLPKQPSRYF